MESITDINDRCCSIISDSEYKNEFYGAENSSTGTISASIPSLYT